MRAREGRHDGEDGRGTPDSAAKSPPLIVGGHRGPAGDVRPWGVLGGAVYPGPSAELVVDALRMARWNRRPQPGTVVHADRGLQHISSIFGLRLRQTGSLSSMGRVASSVDNTMMESLESIM